MFHALLFSLWISPIFVYFLTIRFVVHFYFVCFCLFLIFVVYFSCNKCYFIVSTLLLYIVTLQQKLSLTFKN